MSTRHVWKKYKKKATLQFPSWYTKIGKDVPAAEYYAYCFDSYTLNGEYVIPQTPTIIGPLEATDKSLPKKYCYFSSSGETSIHYSEIYRFQEDSGRAQYWYNEFHGSFYIYMNTLVNVSSGIADEKSNYIGTISGPSNAPFLQVFFPCSRGVSGPLW